MTTQVPQQMIAGGPAFSAYPNSNVSISAGTWTKVQVNTKTFDTANAFDAVTNYRFQPLVAGYYQVNGVVSGAATSATLFIAAIYKNGVEYVRGNDLRGSAGFMASASCTVSSLMYLNGSTDYIELWGYVGGTSPSINGVAMTGGSYFQAALSRAS